MISSKILVHSAAASLMAGAILTSPLFVFGPEDSSLSTTTPCPSRVEYKQPNAGALQQSARFERPVLRAAPEHPHLAPRRGDAVRQIDSAKRSKQLRLRSIEERNRAANQALTQINKAYDHSQAGQRGAQAAHSVVLRTIGKKEATRVQLKTETMVNCSAGNRNLCLRHFGIHPSRGR